MYNTTHHKAHEINKINANWNMTESYIEFFEYK